jgi:UDPglucose--hexose-1-phosphate uridylyltransferase
VQFSSGRQENVSIELSAVPDVLIIEIHPPIHCNTGSQDTRPGMTAFDPTDDPHRRRNALTGEWILVSPHRGKRPWQGQVEPDIHANTPHYDPDCYLCPGNPRSNGEKNPTYTGAFAFSNDFAALQSDTVSSASEDELFTHQAEQGLARVVCFSPDHSRTLAELSLEQTEAVVECWINESRNTGSSHPWVQIFENKGSMMGCSMPHPHSQIWAQNHAPTIPAREADQQLEYHLTHSRPLLVDYCQRENTLGERTVAANVDWLVVVPYWAAWPYETLLLPKFPISRLTELDGPKTRSLADIISQITIRYDNLFECSFPYSMGWHSAPFDGHEHPESQLHAHFYPPLFRSSSVRKFMVGYEMLAEPQRDITPEQAAEKLRGLPDTHYKHAATNKGQ